MLVLLAENKSDLQRILYKFETTYEELNMLILTTKTKSMGIAKEPIKCKIVADNKPIE